MIRLRELREKRGLSMKDAADLLNMPYTTYVNYEKGTREPNIEALFRLADFFEVTIDELLERCAPNEPLTLDELREMDGEPVYVVPKDKPAHCGGWCGVTVWKCDRYSYVSLLRDADSGWGFEKYGKTWIAYRRPPEGEKET